MHHYKADVNGYASLPVLANLFQGIAEENAIDLGFGYRKMQERNQFWALSRMQIELLNPVKVDTHYQLQTWPKRTDKLFALRDYQLLDSDGGEVVKASSAWLIIDGNTRRIIKPGPVFEQYPGLLHNKDALEQVPGKVVIPDRADREDIRTVRYTNLDVNGHMNNAHIIAWIFDIFPEYVFSGSSPDSLLVNFHKELFLNDQVRILASETNSSIWTVWALRENESVFSASVSWKKIS